MSFTWEWALAIFVFLFANLFLGVQLLKLFLALENAQTHGQNA